MTVTIPQKTNVQLFWNTLDRILIEVENLQLTLGDLHFKSPRYQQQIKALEHLVFEYRSSVLEKDVMRDTRFGNYAEHTRRIYDAYEVHDEYKSRHQLLEAITTFSQPNRSGLTDSLLDMSPPIQRTYRYAFLEAKLGDLGADATYCHIGCGSFPETLMAMSSYLKGKGSLAGIDFDERALSLGKAFVEKFGANGMQFIRASGSAVDYSSFTHIHLAVLVRPEQGAIEQICKTASREHGVTLLLRSAYGLGSLIYEPLTETTKNALARNGFVHVETLRGHAIMQTELYRRDHE
jgi:hypothetical protein